MKKPVCKKLLSLALALVLTVAAVPLFSAPASAATSSEVAAKLSSCLPVVTFATPLSGASRVYSYSSSSLSTKTPGYYIDSYVDQIVIIQISSDGKAVLVVYPSSSSATGYRSRWYSAEDILGLSAVSLLSYTASAKSATYRMSASSRVTSYGSIASGDACLRLGSRAVGGKTYYPTVYPISSVKVNGVSGIKHKLALAATPGQTPVTPVTPASGSWQWPMTGCTVTQTFNRYSSSMAAATGRGYHSGMDMVSANTNVCAAAAGTVLYRGYTKGNGYHVILSHSVNGIVVKTLYSHLANYNACPAVGQPVAKGAVIGQMGSSGNSTAPHLHFAVYTGGGTDPYGYTTTNAANRMPYGNYVFYNPAYVVANNGKLP